MIPPRGSPTSASGPDDRRPGGVRRRGASGRGLASVRGPDEDAGAHDDEPVARRRDAEVPADADEEQHGGQVHGDAHVVVGMAAGRGALQVERGRRRRRAVRPDGVRLPVLGHEGGARRGVGVRGRIGRLPGVERHLELGAEATLGDGHGGCVAGRVGGEPGVERRSVEVARSMARAWPGWPRCGRSTPAPASAGTPCPTSPTRTPTRPRAPRPRPAASPRRSRRCGRGGRWARGSGRAWRARPAPCPPRWVRRRPHPWDAPVAATTGSGHAVGLHERHGTTRPGSGHPPFGVGPCRSWCVAAFKCTKSSPQRYGHHEGDAEVQCPGACAEGIQRHRNT